ncbi:hypothetical protein GCM10027051_04180 [Niabella terrae]
MAKSTSQGAFSFLDEVEKTTPLPKPKKNTLKPPSQIVAEETPTVPQAIPAEPPQDSTDIAAVDITDRKAVLEEAVLESAEPENETENPGVTAVAPKPVEKKNTRGRKSVKEHSLAAENIEIPDEETLFSKRYYSMGEVTAMFKENHSLIRYWESEFDLLKPKKNGKGDRFFRPEDVKNLYLIYDLLRRRKFTIEGAREYLRNNKKADEKFAAIQSLEKMKTFFLELKASL